MLEKELSQPLKKENKTKKIMKVCLIISFFILALGIGILSVLEYKGSLSDKAAKVVIRQGAGTNEIAELLTQHQVIKSAMEFRLMAKIQGVDEAWQMGSYQILAHSGYNDIFKQLTTPQTAGIKVTIPEGKQVKQIAKIYEKAGVCNAEEFMNTCDSSNFYYDFLLEITDRTDLEGYLFPDTYYFEKDTEPKFVINEMLANFENQLYRDDYKSRSKELGYTFDEMITLSSIIESEATLKSDRYTISGAFHNRLNNPELYPKLQSCVTVEYAMGIKKTIISLEDTKFESPYNTYLYPGLPIGPICCPSEESLKAALYPEENNYFFFQSDSEGVLHFAETFKEHASIQTDVQKDWHPVDDFAD